MARRAVKLGIVSRQELGRAGEELAAERLSRDGFRILERRWRRAGAEIDIVCERGEQVVFVEVKTRRGEGFGTPAEAVTATKRRRMARAALIYLVRRGWLDRPCRFDVVEVRIGPGPACRVDHIEDAFRPMPSDCPGA